MEQDKELVKLLFPEIRFSNDNDLESWRTYVLREMVEARVEKKPEWELKQIEAWLSAIEDEIARRKVLAGHGAPEYKGENKTTRERVRQLKDYYTGDNFVRLFQQVTGFEVFPGHTGVRWRYRCLVHGEDKNPSGVLYPDQGKYWCYACNAGGDLIHLLGVFPPHLDFIQAIKQLEEWSVPVEYAKKGGKWRVKQ